MWPALVMFWAVSRVVHHSSSCCKGFDHYYCLPQDGAPQILSKTQGYTGSPKSRIAPRKPTFDWEFDLIGRNDHNLKTMVMLNELGAFSVEDNPDEHVNEAQTGPLVSGDTVERVDHYTQLIPETLINTDDELTFVSGADSRDDRVAAPWMEPSNFYKYN